jgi:hypothetical protein
MGGSDTRWIEIGLLLQLVGFVVVVIDLVVSRFDLSAAISRINDSAARRFAVLSRHTEADLSGFASLHGALDVSLTRDEALRGSSMTSSEALATLSVERAGETDAERVDRELQLLRFRLEHVAERQITELRDLIKTQAKQLEATLAHETESLDKIEADFKAEIREEKQAQRRDVRKRAAISVAASAFFIVGTLFELKGTSGNGPKAEIVFASSTLTDWLTVIGGFLVFAATAALAFLAYRQMQTLGVQSKAAQDQVKAANEQVKAANDQVEIMRRASADEAAAMRDQIKASVEHGEATREAARAQLQPIVFAHGDAVNTGPDNGYDLGEGEIGFGYRLANEGTGIALNIRHGVEIDGIEFEFGGGMQWRALRPSEAQPAFDFVDAQGDFIHVKPFVVACSESDLPERWRTLPRSYWARFESVFGEKFKTTNPNYPERPASFVRVDDPDRS